MPGNSWPACGATSAKSAAREAVQRLSSQMNAQPRVPHNATSATTRMATAVRVPLDRAGRLFVPSEIVTSPESRLQYRIERLLGEGGFGQVYLATRIGRSLIVPETVCIKASTRMDGWLREAYFGQLLDGHPRAVRVFDTFPLVRSGGQPLYCLALEYA